MQQSRDTIAAPSGLYMGRIAVEGHQGAADDGLDEDADNSDGADGLAADVRDESAQSGATSTYDDPRFLCTIIERLCSSQRFTDTTNQDCAALVRRSDRLGSLVATSKSLASE